MDAKTDKQLEEERLKEEMRLQNEAFTSIAFEAFTQHYPPAANLGEATRFFTSDEISDAIKKLFPTAYVDAYLVSMLLTEYGYQFTAMKDNFNIVFKWMTK